MIISLRHLLMSQVLFCPSLIIQINTSDIILVIRINFININLIFKKIDFQNFVISFRQISE